MTQATLPRPRGAVDAEDEQHGLPTRPIEDRGFEAVETTVGVVGGVVIGMAVAGPVGAVVGGLAGAGVAFAAAEAVERAQGLASLTTDAQERPRRDRDKIGGGAAMPGLNPLGVGQCLWSTTFTNPGRGCRKLKGHLDAHDLYGQSGIPSDLKTREEQEAWAEGHAPAWEMDRARFQRRLQDRARTFGRK